MSPFIQDRICYSLREVAAVLGISLRQVWSHWSKDGLPVRILGERLRRVTRADLAAWCETKPRYRAVGVELRRPLEAGLLRAPWLKMCQTRRVLSVGEVAVLDLERRFGMPVNREGGPSCTVGELERWAAGLPLLTQEQAKGVRPSRT